MLESAGRELGKRLSGIFDLLNNETSSVSEIRTAFHSLLSIEMLGPAFATKFLYFVSPETARIPIFDSQVADWLNSEDRRSDGKQAGRLSAQNARHFFEYLEFCRTAAKVLNIVDVGLLEYLMFMDQRAALVEQNIDSLPMWIRRKRLLLRN